MNIPFLFMAIMKLVMSPVVRLAGYLAIVTALSACFAQASEQELLDRARLALEQGNARAAVIDVKTALQESPDSAPARRLLGEIYLFQQIPAAAAEEFERALSASADDELRVLYARALLTGGGGMRLLELDQQNEFAGIAANPQYLATIALARAQGEGGDLSLARKTMDEALDAGPADPYVTTSNAFFMLIYSGAQEEAQASLLETVASHPDYVEAWSLLGAIQQMSGELALAETSYARVAELNSYRLSDRLNLVSVRLDQGNNTAARSELDRLLASYPDHPGVNYIEGRMLIESGDNAAALTTLNKVLNVQPTHAGSLYLAAIANIREENLATALGQLESLLAMQPLHLNGRLLLANLHMRMAEPRRAEDLARSILEEDDMNYSAMGLLATALSAQGLDRDPGNLERMDLYQRMALVRPGVVEPRLALAQLQLQHGRHADAERLLSAIRESHPESPALWLSLIDALMGQGKMEEADSILADLPEEFARQYAVLVAKGRIALARDEPADAEPYLRSAVEQSPQTLPLLWLSGAVAAQGRDREAAELLVDWLVDNPDDVLVRNQLATHYMQTGDDSQALLQYQKILEQLQDNVLVLNNLAWLLRHDDPQRAMTYIERANQLAPDNPQIMDTYAMIQLERSARDDALTLNRKALDLMPNDPQILYHRALILQADGQAEQAVPILEALVGTAEPVYRERAQTLLAELQGQ